MSAKLKITTRVRRILDYIGDIENGLIQIPGFQRDFIWTMSDMIELFNSLKMGYPIGTILLWKPSQRYGENTKIGPYIIPQTTDNFFYVLDGFQRISTLIGCLINPSKTELEVDENLLKNFRIFYDLRAEEFAPQRTKTLEYYQVPVYKLIDNKETFLWQRQLFDKDEEEIELLLERYEEIGNTLLSFHLPSIDINGGSVDEAVDIFWRLNSKGSTISTDWIVSARTYDIDKNFRLGTEIDNLLAELKPFNFQNIKREVVLQCIQSAFGKIYFEMKMDEVVTRPDFMEKSQHTITSLKKAVKFLYEELLVVDSKLLPATIQLVFITQFFNRIPNPSTEEKETLKRWFWQTSYSNYFTILSPSKRKEAFSHFLDFWSGNAINEPFYNDKPGNAFVVSDFPVKIHFGSVRAKALVLFMLNYNNDFKSIDSNLDNEFILSFLFYDKRNEKGDYYPSSIVPILRNNSSFRSKLTDSSYLLESWNEDLSKYFIDKNMIELYHLKNIDEIISYRKMIIKVKEKEFVEKLGLVYEDSQFSTSNY